MNKTNASKNFPGMLAKHYSPLTKIILSQNIEETIKENPGKKIGLLLFKSKIKEPTIQHQEVLSKKGNLIEAAFGLYLSMHLLDNLDLDIIIAEKFPNKDLGQVINDRLMRASK